MGIAQAFALFPGISRLGIVISVGILLGLARKSAVNFAFLMFIPVIFGASLLALKDVLYSIEYISSIILQIIIGFVSSVITGCVLIKLFLKILQDNNLFYFAIYCLIVGIISLMLL